MTNFEKFIKGNGLKQVDVADYLSVSKAFITKLINGDRSIPKDKYELLKRHPSWDTSMLSMGDASIVRHSSRNQIVILPQSAVAGYLSENNGADSVRTNEFIAFVDFMERSADFAIRVDGDSMYPRYNNGDVLACRILQDRTLFDFGRVYVLNTRNGCVVKKVLPVQGSRTSVLCHSENPLYPDYELSTNDILGVAVVVGHAGVE